MQKTNQIITLIFVVLVSFALVPREARCSLTAEADWGYLSNETTSPGYRSAAHSMTQRYSVYYSKSERLVNGRFGHYDVTLGYQLLTYDTSVKSTGSQAESFGESKGKILYSGEMLVNPKEMPLKIKIFSKDMTGGSFLTGGEKAPRSIVSGIQDVQHVETGATLVMGVKNGMTNGYNEVLRHLPMLMLDYRDTIYKDRSSTVPVDTHLSRLAFVSLNKKDNWFHYRYVTFEDYIDNGNNYQETQVQLGTVDHMLQRRWIDFTNWLKVSADGQFTKNVKKNDGVLEDFSLNVFGTALRKKWGVRTFNNFTRINDRSNSGNVIYKTAIPVYVDGIISRDSDWNAFVKYNNNHTDKGVYFNTLNGGYAIDAFRSSSFTLRQTLNAESISSPQTETLLMSGSVSTNSTQRFSRKWLVSASYNISNSHYNSHSEIKDSSSSFTEQKLNTSASYNLNNYLRISVNQRNSFSTGTWESVVSTVSGATTNSPQYETSLENMGKYTSTYRSLTNLDVSWNPLPHLDIDFIASNDLITSQPSGKTEAVTLGFNLSYSDSNFKFSTQNKYLSTNAGKGTSVRVSSANLINYMFNRNLEMSGKFSYVDDSAVHDGKSINVEQGLNYSMTSIMGFSRKLLEVTESVTYSESASKRNYGSRLGIKYYPLRQMMIGAGGKYSFVDNFKNENFGYYGSLSVEFRLLSAGLEYTYGKTKLDNVVEKRISANVRKRF